MNLDVTFGVPNNIVQGLNNGSLERIGGIIRDMQSKQVVHWLRDISETDSAISNTLNPFSSIAAISNLSNIASILNFSISTMGFALVLHRLGVIQQQLVQAQEVLSAIDYKINLSFYANFRAAIDLARNAFTMTNAETRKISAMQAINRFFEAEHHYTKLTDIEIENGSQVADEYLATLCLAYVTEARCYLELEELDTARRRLHEATGALRPRFEKHIHTLLTSNPAAYLHPSLADQVGLKRLTKIYQWLEPGIDENDVFEMQRENLFNLAQTQDKWFASLPQAICIPKGATQTNVFTQLAKQSKKIIGSLPSKAKTTGSKTDPQAMVAQSPEIEILGHLPATMALMESMIENDDRLAVYESEVEMIQQLGMSFQEWQQLAPPSAAQGNETDLILISVPQK